MRRRASDAGAVIVEAALALVLLSILFIGVTEYGFAWRQTGAVEKTVQQSARVAGNMADQSTADFETLQAFRSFLGSTKNLTVDYIVVYRSTTADGAMPSACATGPVAGTCNRYVAADLSRPSTDFGCGATEPDRFWCPTASGSQLGRQRDRTPSPDYIGVQAQVRYRGITGLISGTMAITRRAVYSIEPCAFGLPGC